MNFIVGGNESGKSTLRRALAALLSGEAKEPELQVWDSKEIPKVRVELASTPAGQGVVVLSADLLNGQLHVGSSAFSDPAAFCAELEKVFEAPGLAQLPPFLKAPLELPEGLQQRLLNPSPEQKARLTRERSAALAASVTQLDEANLALKAVQARLAELESAEKVLEKRRELEAVKALAEQARAARQELEKRQEVWAEATRLTEGLQTLQMMADMVRGDVERLQGLRQTLERYSNYQDAPETLPHLLQQLAFERADAARVDKAAEAAEVAAKMAGDAWHEAQAELEKQYPEYQHVDKSFPIWLHRYQTLHETLAQEKAALQELLKKRQTLDSDLDMFIHFKDVPSDYQVSLGALLEQQKESNANIASLEKELGEAGELEKEIARLEAGLLPVFEKVGEDLPQRIANLEKGRQEAAELTSHIEAVKAKLEAHRQAVAPFIELASSWPANFMDWLAERRSRFTTQVRGSLLADAVQSEATQLRLLAEQYQLQLAKFDGLEQQDRAFPARLEELNRVRQDLEKEEASFGQFMIKLDEAKEAAEAGRRKFRTAGPDYPERVEQLKAKVAELQEQRVELEQARARRGDLEKQVQDATEALKTKFPDLAGAPTEFPASLREYFRLKEVLSDLQTRQGALEAELNLLDTEAAPVVARFASFQQELERLQSTRSWDDVLYRELKRIEWELAQREAGASSDLQQAWQAQQELLREIDQTLNDTRAVMSDADRAAQLEAFLKLSTECRVVEELLSPVAAGVEQQADPDDMARRLDLPGRRSRLAAEAERLAVRDGEDASRQLQELREASLLGTQLGLQRERVAAVLDSLSKARDQGLSMLRTREELEESRAGLIAMVSARLSEAGLARLDPADYLAWQSWQAARARVLERQDMLVRRSGTTSDVERIAAKLADLQASLGDAIKAPLEETLTRYEQVTELRATIARLTTSLQELPDADALEATIQAAQAEVHKGLERLGLKQEDELADAVPQYHEYRSVLSTLNTLEDLKRTQWHETVMPDGQLETDLDRLRERRTELEERLGSFAQQVQTTEELQQVLARWKQACAINDELKAINALIPGTLAAVEPAAGGLEVEADADLLRWVWDQRQAAEAMDAEVVQLQATLQMLQTTLASQEASVPPASELPPAAELLASYEADRVARASLAAVRERVKGRRSPDEVKAQVQQIRQNLKQRFADLKLDEGVALELVLQEFDDYRRMVEEHRDVVKELSAKEFSLQNLESEAEVLRGKLGGRESIEPETEMQRYNAFRDQRDAVMAQQKDHEAATAEATQTRTEAAEAQERLHAVEAKCSKWAGSRDLNEVGAEYNEYVRLKADLEALEQRVKPAELEAMEQQIAGLRQSQADLPKVPEKTADFDAQLEERRKTEADQVAPVEAIQQELQAAETACSTPVTPELETEMTNLKAEVERLTTAAAEAQAAHDKADKAGDQPALARCQERASGLLATLTRGRYLQMSRDEGTIWLTPARGPRVQLEKATGMQRP
ncbi:MAG: hypothetical protein ACYCW6_13980, partial [Candidatus Xenobia bacterium]